MIVLLTAEACNTHTSKNRFVPILIHNSYIRVGMQGVKLHLIQVPIQLNFSLWQPNPEN